MDEGSPGDGPERCCVMLICLQYGDTTCHHCPGCAFAVGISSQEPGLEQASMQGKGRIDGEESAEWRRCLDCEAVLETGRQKTHGKCMPQAAAQVRHVTLVNP
jgi:hypothetical protein